MLCAGRLARVDIIDRHMIDKSKSIIIDDSPGHLDTLVTHVRSKAVLPLIQRFQHLTSSKLRRPCVAVMAGLKVHGQNIKLI